MAKLLPLVKEKSNSRRRSGKGRRPTVRRGKVSVRARLKMVVGRETESEPNLGEGQQQRVCHLTGTGVGRGTVKVSLGEGEGKERFGLG